MNELRDNRNYTEMSNALMLAQYTVYKRYLPELSMYPIVTPTERLKYEKTEECLRFCQLEELSCKQGEDIFQKLSTVYHASMSLGCNLAVMIDVANIGGPVKIYVGVQNGGEDEEENRRLGTSFSALKKGMESNFPGTKLRSVSPQAEMGNLLEDIFEHVKSVSSVSCVAAIRDKSNTQNKDFVQGLEHFIDTMRGNTYTAIFIAEPISEQEQAEIRNGYESLYSILSAFRKSTWSYQENESDAVMESLSEGISQSVSEGTSNTQSHTKSTTKTIGANIGINLGNNRSVTEATAYASGQSSPTGVSRAGSAIAGVAGIAGTVGAAFFPPLALVGAAGSVVGSVMQGSSVSSSVMNSLAKTVGKSLGLSAQVSTSRANTQSDTTSTGTSYTQTSTTSTTKTSGATRTVGTGRTLQIENVNKTIEEMLKRIEDQLKRVQEGEDYGAYNCGAYFLSSKQNTTLLAANTYRALMIGEGTSIESGAINTWDIEKGEEQKNKVDAIKEYLRRFRHPIFVMPVYGEKGNVSDYVTYTAGTTVSGLELPLHLGVPTKSVYGLPVIEHAEFGRNVTKKTSFQKEDERKIKIGEIYHMGKTEKSKVKLDLSELTAHTFVTGSTGAGKSNFIYNMLDRLGDEGVRFMVVEPAKGEYKNRSALGGRKDVIVLGTNPKLSDMGLLRINPFSFPQSIHVLEHIDRLVEIFNVCWPMYAAMPAILKDAVVRAYEIAGWDLENSVNRYDSSIFPSFSDVYEQIRRIMEESDYSQDNKGDYTGALVTRLKSLTNGINGLVFDINEISADILFQRNVIVDLSRVGSTETKSLIMGVLILKLQEYRMNENVEPNQKLRHVTVLEEAHNLLRRTSMEQTGEESNLMGKAVEMLANSIAEMRTYGEGFIVADQSPGLLDLSVIRNTNTKVIFRLPDLSDRELVGRSAGLEDDQIAELAKLDNGVAAIKQGEWLETVLCRIDKHEAKIESSLMIEKTDRIFGKRVNSVKVRNALMKCIMENELYRKGDRVEIQNLKGMVLKSKMSSAVKCDYIEYINAAPEKVKDSFRKLLYDFLDTDKAVREADKENDIKDWVHSVAERLNPSLSGYPRGQQDMVMAYLIYEQAERNPQYTEIFKKYTNIYRSKGGLF